MRLADCIVGAGAGIVNEGEPSGVEGVTDRAGDHVNKTRGSATILGTIGRDGNLEFLNGILAKDVGHFLATARTAEIVAGGAGAVDRERVGAVGVGVAGVLSRLFTGKAHKTVLSIRGSIGNQQR